MSAITCEWGLEKQQDTNGAQAQNKSRGVVTSICAASLAPPSPQKKIKLDKRFQHLLSFVWWCVSTVLLHLRKHCLYCFMAFAEMLPEMTEIPRGCGRRTSTDNGLRTHAFLPPSAATRWRYVVRSCRELHYAYQRPLSFKNFYFPLFEYANVLSIVIHSHLASTPSCCCPVLVSLHLSVSFSCKQKQKKTM